MPQTHFVQCPGNVQTVVHELGGSGPPLLVLPANGFPSRAYLPCLSHLQAHFRCLGVDLRGNGGETPSGPGHNMLHFAEDISCVIQALRLTGAYAFGHSVGGTSALRAAGAHPGCLSAVYCYEPVIYDPHPGAEQSDSGSTQHLDLKLGGGDAAIVQAELLVVIAKKRKKSFASRDEARSKFASRPPFSTFAAESLEAYCTHGFRDIPGGVELRCNPEDEADTYAMLPRHMSQIWAEASHASCPVVILAGNDHSRNGRTLLAGKLPLTAAALPNAAFERLPELFHMGPLQDPARVAACVLTHHCNLQAKRPGTALLSRL